MNNRLIKSQGVFEGVGRRLGLARFLLGGGGTFGRAGGLGRDPFISSVEAIQTSF